MKFPAATRSPSALLLSLVSLLLSVQSAGGSKHPVGVRLVFDDGKPPEGKICTPEEMKVVSHLLYQRIERMLEKEAKKGGVRHRSRRTQGTDDNFDDYIFDDDATGVGNNDPLHCPDVCRGFAEGTCVIGYPECDETRRLEATPVVKEADTTFLSKDFLSMCVSEEEAALDAIRGGVAGVSESCNELLKDHVDVKCFELERTYDNTVDDREELREQSRSKSFLPALILVLALSTTALLIFVRQRSAPMDDEPTKGGNMETSAQLV